MTHPPLTTPPLRRSPAFLLAFALANAGAVVAYLPLLSLLLPLKVQEVAGPARLEVLSLGAIVGALVASLSNVAFGWASDRSVRRGGGRRRWIAGGVAGLAASYAGIVAAATPAAIVVAVAAFQIAANAILAPLMALMADEIPDEQRGLAGGLLALGQPVAAGVAAILMALSIDMPARLAAIPAVALACLLPLLLLRRAPAAPAPPSGQVPADRRDLPVAFLARLLVQVAGVISSLYLLYYVESLTPADAAVDVPRRVSHLLTLAFLLPLPAAILAGGASDRVGRRKPFLLAAAIVAAAGLVAMALAHGWPAGAAGFVAFTIGSAVFMALHAAFAMQLLPDPAHRGRDLGVLNLTNTLPSLIGPLLAWQFATLHDFSRLLLLLAGSTLAGGLLVLGVRSRR